MISVGKSLAGRLVATLLVGAMTFVPAAAFAQRAGRGANNPIRNIPVSGVAEDGQSFTGFFSIERFQEVDGTVVAVGDLSGKFSDGKPVNHQSVAWPLQSIEGTPIGGTTAALTPKPNAVPATYDPSRPPTIVQTQAACDILTLVLGPLHLDLLGLVVDLNQVELNITAVPGAGNLLGNLLCAIAGLLDPGPLGSLTQLVALLNQLVNFLNGVIDLLQP